MAAQFMDRLRKFGRWQRGILAAATAFPLLVRAQEASPPPIAALRSGTLSFTGHATVGTFVGSTSVVSGMVTGDLSSARGWVEAPVSTLDTQNALRDRDMQASMEAGKYPVIRFDLARVGIVSAAPGGDSVDVRLHGTLTIHGVARDVVLPATLSYHADSTHLTAGFPLDLVDFRIGGLKKAFGLLRMQRQIEVRVDLWFERADPRTAWVDVP
jgi:polyisoprenoid-binding protein YceI